MNNKKYIKAIRVDINEEVEVRKMSDDEIYNDDCQHYCNDETGHIYKETELNFNRDE